MFKILFQAVLQFSMLFLFPMLGCHFFKWIPHIVHIDSICVSAIFLVFSVVYWCPVSAITNCYQLGDLEPYKPGGGCNIQEKQQQVHFNSTSNHMIFWNACPFYVVVFLSFKPQSILWVYQHALGICKWFSAFEHKVYIDTERQDFSFWKQHCFMADCQNSERHAIMLSGGIAPMRKDSSFRYCIE